MYEDRVDRWTDLLEGKRRSVLQVECAFDAPPQVFPREDNIPQRLDFIKGCYDVMAERARWLDDDRIPSLQMMTGTEIMARAFGCGVYYPEDNMPVARPLVHNAREAAALRVPDIFDCPITYLFDMADALRAYAGPDALFRMVDLQSPMDVAALIWDKSEFYIQLIEDETAVLDLAGKIYQFMTAFLDEWFRRYGKAFIAHYPYYYMPYGITLSEDEIGAVNTDMFERLFLPELNALSNRYGQIGIHCCANAQHQWDGLLSVENLRLINLVQPPKVIREATRRFVDVIQMHNPMGEAEVFMHMDAYPPEARVVLQPWAATRDDALRIVEAARA